MAMESMSPICTDAITQAVPVRVLLRLKPHSGKAAKLSYVEDGSGAISLQDFPQVAGKTAFSAEGNDTNKFRFNKVYDVNVMQQDVCKDIIGDSVHELLDGYNITIMAFGQVGSGKTYTMFGYDQEEGVIPKICQSLFDQLDSLHEDGMEVTVGLEFFEVFAENVYDLLARPRADKALKTSSDPKTHILSIKGLRNVVTTSARELQAYITEVQRGRSSLDAQFKSSRSSAFIRISVGQRSKKEGTMKTSILQLVDLASSDKLEKSGKLNITSDEVKTINSSMQNLVHVTYGLADMKLADKHAGAASRANHDLHRSSRLAKLLRNAIGGNSKTTAVIMCSTERINRGETLSALNLGTKLRSINNCIEQNKMALNAKAVMDLAMKNMRIRENSYLTRIKFLEDEVDKLGGTIQQNRADLLLNKSLSEENAKLKDEVNLIRKAKEFNVSENQGGQVDENGNPQADFSEILENLMEKCEKVIQLQLRLDEELHLKSSLSRQFSYRGSKVETLEAMNVKLLEQLDTNENELKNVLNVNTLLRKDVEKWSNVAVARSEKIEELEKENQEHQVGSFPQNRRLVSADEFSHYKDDTKLKKSNWLFGNSNGNIWGTRKVSAVSAVSAVSTSSVMTTNSQDSNNSKASLKGLNLHAIRLPSSTKNENHANGEKARTKKI